LSVLFFCLGYPLIYAQQTYTLSGIISDAESGETLVGASVKITGAKQSGTTTNPYGFYSITLPSGAYEVTVSYIGYKTVAKKLDIRADQKLNIKLQSSTQLQEVVVSAERRNENVTNPQM